MNIVVPIFHQGRLVAFAVSFAHVPDIGGSLRSPSNWEVYEERLHITPMKLIASGTTNDTLVMMISDNVRVNAELMGNIWAQVSCDRSPDRRLTEFLDETGVNLATLGKIMCERADNASEVLIEGSARLPDRAPPEGLE